MARVRAPLRLHRKERVASPESIRPLHETLRYRNESVVRKFREGYAVTAAQADELFTELKRWLWLNATAGADTEAPELFISAELIGIDEMWHTFVLFTKEYAAFCQRYFGQFLHHAPTTFEQKRRRVPLRDLRDRSDRAADYICATLGDDTFIHWYGALAKRYSSAQLEKRRRPLPRG